MKRIIIFIVIAIAVLAVSAYYLEDIKGLIGRLAVSEPNEGNTEINEFVEFLQQEDLVVGEGEEVKNGDTVLVDYIGTFENGEVFDSSLDRGESFEFVVGSGEVIKGWDEGILGMKVGGKRKLIIPPSLAYGETGFGEVIPPQATLIFEVELLEIKNSE